MKAINILLVITVCIFPSCEDFLTETPPDEYSEASVWQTETDVRLSLNAIYRRVPGFIQDGSGFITRSEIMFQNFVDDGFNRLTNKSTALDFTPTSQVVTNNYGRHYEAIRLCNEFIERAPGVDMDQDLLNRYLAEARFVRAHHYDRLNFIFGDVPLVTETINFDVFPKRAPRNRVFDFVTDELNAIAPELPWTYSGNDVDRFTRGAALGLLARHLLNGLSWYGDDASLYAQARVAAQEVYDNGPYSLEPGADGFERLFTPAMENGGAAGVIWTSNYDLVTRNHSYQRAVLPKGAFAGTRRNNSNYISATNRLIEAFQMLNGRSISDPTSGYDPANPWVDRDPRLDIAILRAGESIPRVGGDGVNDLYTFDPHPAITPADGVNTDDIGRSVSKTGYNFQKYVDYDFVTSQESGIDYIMMRYAEIILMYAEALVGESAGNIAQAMSLVDEVRTRVGMPTVADTYGGVADQQQAIDIILQERRFEFACEGPHRYFDIKRYRLGEELFTGDNANVYGIPLGPNRVPDPNVLEGDLDNSVKALAGVRQFNPDTYYWWPLPQSAVDSNPMLLEDPE